MSGVGIRISGYEGNGASDKMFLHSNSELSYCLLVTLILPNGIRKPFLQLDIPFSEEVHHRLP
jgi:hypothetical protein